jgi:hypothetical protein
MIATVIEELGVMQLGKGGRISARATLNIGVGRADCNVPPPSIKHAKLATNSRAIRAAPSAYLY